MPNWKKVVTSGSNAILNQITASGNISASGIVYGSTIQTAGLYKFPNDTVRLTESAGGNAQFYGGGLEVTGGTGNITASGNISASGTITAEHIVSSDDIVASGNISASGNVYGDWGVFANRIVTPAWRNSGITITSDNGSMLLQGNITASSNISASGGIFTEAIYMSQGNSTTKTLNINPNSNGPQFAADSHTLQVYGNIRAGLNTATQHEFNGNISASGNITASGTLFANNAQFGSSTVYIDGPAGHITASGDISASGNIIATGTIRGKQLQVYHANWKGNAGTTPTFIPLAGVPDEMTSATKEQSSIIMPCSGTIKEIILRMHWTSTITTSDDITWKIYNRESNKKMNSETQLSTFTMTNPTQGADDVNNTRSSGELTQTYSAGDAIMISMQWATTGPTNTADRMYVTVVVENDWNTIGY